MYTHLKISQHDIIWKPFQDKLLQEKHILPFLTQHQHIPLLRMCSCPESSHVLCYILKCLCIKQILTLSSFKNYKQIFKHTLCFILTAQFLLSIKPVLKQDAFLVLQSQQCWKVGRYTCLNNIPKQSPGRCFQSTLSTILWMGYLPKYIATGKKVFSFYHSWDSAVFQMLHCASISGAYFGTGSGPIQQ